MASQIKHLVFKGIEKKEQILFKSFLNLSKNELAYQVVILKDADTSESPDIVIMDESFDIDNSDLAGKVSAKIVVGTDIHQTKDGYIARPVQWSDFKSALSQLNLEQSSGVQEADQDDERVLPAEMKFSIPKVDEPTEDILEPISPEAAEAAEAGFSDESDYEYELDNMSIDYHSFSNSEIDRAADDVKNFNESDAAAAEAEPQIMFTDDESASVNSVLVIETNSLDAWDFSEADIPSELDSDEGDIDAEAFVQDPDNEVVLEKKAGFDIAPDEEFWKEDNEIIVDHEGFLFIKPERDLVYSNYEPGKWPQLMQTKKLSKLPLPKDWRPKHELTGYPIANLLWVNTLINDTLGLADDLDPEQEYMLESWPDFDLIQLDNILLKLCTMLFVKGETAASLSQSSGFGLSTVYGLINACHQMGLIKKAEDVQLEKLTAVSAEGSMLGKIKDVFR